MATKQQFVPMILLLLFLFAGKVNAQMDITLNYPSAITPFELKAKDNRGREIGYFKYNQNTDRLVIRGNIKPAMKWFVNQYFLPNWEVFNAQQKVLEQMNMDGTVKDAALFAQAWANYFALKKKYGM